MLHKDPSQRPTLHEIQNAPFFWTDKQKQDHVKFILRGPKVDAIEKKVCFIIFTTFYGYDFLSADDLTLNFYIQQLRQLIPSTGHFDEMPDSLSSIRDADSGEEAIKILSDEYCQNPFDKEPLIQGTYLV